MKIFPSCVKKIDFAYFVSTICIIISPSFSHSNAELSTSYLVLSAVALICFVFIAAHTTVKELDLVVLVLAMIYFGLQNYYRFDKLLYCLLVFFCYFKSLGWHQRGVLDAIKFLIILNYLLVVFQFLGIFDFFYQWSSYANDAVPVSVLTSDSPIGFLPQLRPSGIFPSPTYISFFLIIVTAALLLNKRGVNWVYGLLIGSLFALTGSSLSYLLLFGYMVINVGEIYRTKSVVLGWVLTMVLIIYAAPTSFEYNYSVSDMVSSLFERDLAESIIVQAPILIILIAITLMVAVAILLRARKFNKYYLSPILISVGPVIIHNTAASVLYAFVLGMCVNMFFTGLNDKNA